MSRQPNIHPLLPYSFGQVVTAIADEQRPVLQSIIAKPFLKWVGGKRSILNELLARIPKKYDTYHEPFLGGGALFFALKPKKAYLSDINFRLIIAFQAVRDDVEHLIALLKIHAVNHSKSYYLEMRERLSTEEDPTEIAGLFIYLNKTCFNGLYRVNQRGQFNVPMGDYKNPAIVDEENLLAVSASLKNTEIMQQDFSQIKPVKGGFYYIDPPYHTTYDGYDGKDFGDTEHIRLADFCRIIDKVGGYFMVSNSDTDLVRRIYKGYNINQVSSLRTISCKGYQRGKANELIIRNYK